MPHSTSTVAILEATNQANLLCMISLSKVEVKSEQQATAGQVRAGCTGRTWRCRPALPEPGILVVKGKASPTGHDRIPAISERIHVNVPQIRWGAGRRLLRHSLPLGTLDK